MEARLTIANKKKFASKGFEHWTLRYSPTEIKQSIVLLAVRVINLKLVSKKLLPSPLGLLNALEHSKKSGPNN